MVRKLKSKTGGQGNILKQAQEMQARMIAVQEELKNNEWYNKNFSLHLPISRDVSLQGHFLDTLLYM